MASRRTSIALALALLVAALAPPLAVGEIIGVGDADLHPPGTLAGGDLRLWNTRRIQAEHSLTFVDEIAGASAARFEIRPDDTKVSDGYRAEIRDPYVAEPGEEVWYRFRTLIPADFPFSQSHSVVLAQWHDRKSEGRPAQRPQLALRLVQGQLRITLWNDAVFADQGEYGDGHILFATREFAVGKWIDFVYGARWSADEQGMVQVWLDGEQVVDYRGPVGYRLDLHGPYFKLGVYTVHEFEKPMTIYHTGFRRSARRR